MTCQRGNSVRAPVDDVAGDLLGDDLVDEGEVSGQRLVEDRPPGGGHDATAVPPARASSHASSSSRYAAGRSCGARAACRAGAARSRPACARGGRRALARPRRSRQDRQPGRVTVGGGVRLRVGQPVDAEHHVLGRRGDRTTGRRRQDVVRREHQQPRLGLGLGRQRQVHRHLVTVEVGVERGADQRVQLDRLALDQGRHERLDPEPVQGRRAVEHHRVVLDDLLEHVPDLRARRSTIRFADLMFCA
jgi:hypothetical protein